MQKLNLLVTGDFSPGGNFSGINYDPLAQISKLIDDSDLVWSNLECAIPFGESPIKNNSCIVPGDVEFLKNSIKSRKFVFSMANNHAMDYGLISLIKTKSLLNTWNTKVFGVGPNQQEAREPFFTEINGVKICFLAYTSDKKWVGDHLKNIPGKYISILSEDSIAEVKKYSKEADHTFVGLHFGREFIDYPIWDDMMIARRMIDAGASCIIGHHPHVIQGHEVHNGKPIFYSLGNFMFPPYTEPQVIRPGKKETKSILVKFELDKSKLNWQFYPTRLNLSTKQVELIEGNEEMKIREKIKQISEVLKLDKEKYEHLFIKHLKKTSLLLILRGSFRNILHPKRKHFGMVWRLVKQFIFGLPQKQTSFNEKLSTEK